MPFSYYRNRNYGSTLALLTDSTYLQVLSLSSSWRSLQCSSVCLQEHRQVAGSCTNKRFLLSEQWSQHGSQTLDRDRQRWGGRGREADYHSVQLPPLRKATLSKPFRMLQFALPSHCPTGFTACDSWVVLHTGSHRAGKYSSSKITLPHAPQTLPRWLDRSQMPCVC